VYRVKKSGGFRRGVPPYTRAVSSPVAVLGGGSFGTCLAVLASRKHDVVLWARDPDVVDGVNQKHANPRYLRDIALPRDVRATVDLAEALHGRELVIVSVPSHAVRPILAQALPHLAPGAVLVATMKGIEIETGMTMNQVFEDVLPKEVHPRVVYLSGPSFAREIAEHKPTAVTLASREENYAISVQSSLSTPWFRCYSHHDVVGVEVGGAVKNVVAIAVGMCDGLDMGLNARAGLMTRGLREITRLGVELGANPLTFQGLSGMGDLILTCTGGLSRNRRVGLELGQGKTLDEIISGMDEVAEGVKTTYAVCRLAARLGVEMPIADAVRDVLDGRVGPKEVGFALLSRQLRTELE
jgi:glycerol-3-phosphate dehydrogenase (NAD(P)+)